jgi:hypothetical protein
MEHSLPPPNPTSPTTTPEEDNVVSCKFFNLLKTIQKSTLLLFLDNLDELPNDSKLIQFLDDVMDACPNAKVLMTCREATTEKSEQEQVLEVKGFADERHEAWNLFEQYADINVQ